MKQIDEIVNDRLNLVWQEQILDVNASATANQEKPQGYVLGGQPGAGKSALIEDVKNLLNRNVIVINGDDFRKYYPDYEKLQKEQGQDSPKFTAEFAGKMTEAIFNKAMNEKYNIVIEGTFRTSETPIKTLQQLKNNHYETTVLIKTCHQDISWNSCLERYNKMLETNPKEARFTDKAHHDLVVQNLAKNIKEVFKSGLVDNMQVFVRTAGKGKDNDLPKKEIYNSNSKKMVNTETINKYVFGEKRLSLDNGLGNTL